MRIRLTLVAAGSTALLLACGGKDTPPADTAAAMAPAPAPAPAAPTSAIDAVKGKWNVRSVPAAGTDTTATMSMMDLSGDTASWTMTFPAKPGSSVKLHVTSAAGDSVTFDSDVYESVRRKGMQVHTTSVLRASGDKVTGTTTAHYHTKGADSVLVLKSEGTKAP